MNLVTHRANKNWNQWCRHSLHGGRATRQNSDKMVNISSWRSTSKPKIVVLATHLSSRL